MKIEKFNEICNYLKEVIDNSSFTNHVFCVGGCCRDEILYSEIKDIDIAVDIQNGGIKFANWLYKKKLLAEKPVTFPAYSTVQFKLKKFPDIELEAVQTRKEKYTDKSNRNPITAFGTIKEDCFRRDLTINSLYKNLSTGKILDITNSGISDIKNHIIRTPLNPDETFDDDPLRMLRCIRFAARYNWKISENTWMGILKNSERLIIISHERIRDELNKMLSSDYPAYALKMLFHSSLYKFLFGKAFDKVRNNESNFKKLLDNLGKLSKKDFLLKLSFIMLFICQNENEIKDILMNLKYSNKEIDDVTAYFKIVNNFDKAEKNFGDNIEDWWCYSQQYICQSEERFDNSIKLFCLFSDSHSIVSHLKDSKKYNFFDYHLPVSGNDVMKFFSIPPSYVVKSKLDELMITAFKNPNISNNKDLLLNKILNTNH